MPYPTIFYVRHGQTNWNAELRFQGRRDIALNDTGRAQARASGAKLKTLVGDIPDPDFVSSPLSRARETMEIMRQAMGLRPGNYRIDERLIEGSYGDLEGVTLAEYKAANPLKHEQRKRDRWGFKPPGGEDFGAILARVTPFVAELARPSVISSHGMVGRVLRYHLLGLDKQEAAGFTFPQDKVFIWRDGGEQTV